jgi:ribosome-associated protein
LISPESLKNHVVQVLEDRKARDIVALNVTDACSFTDYMVIASGTSNRHVKSLVDYVVESSKADGNPPIGVEGREVLDWVLLDLGDVVVHVMRPESRAFYELERLWSELPSAESTL